jgi:lipopolysaccharide transport system ATP-binding protein
MIVISVENLSKYYRLGAINRRTLSQDLDRWWALLRGRPDPFVQADVSPDSHEQQRSIWALRDLNFEVEQGEVLAVIGRNGAGKSTLLKVLARITAPTTGQIRLRGRVASLLEVGTGFHPELTGRENVFLNGAILGMRREEIRRKFDEIVAFAEVERFIDTPVKRYSSGMHVRLAFAVAAHLEPEILIVDEVLAVGDAAFQKKCLGKMGDVAREGRTVLFVSHNMAAVRKLCSRGVLLEQGRISMSGAVDPVVNAYLSTSAATMTPVVQLPPGDAEAPGAATVLRLFARDGTPQAQFRLNEAWRMVLEFEICRPVEHVIAAIGLVTTDQIGVVTFWSKPRDLPPGRYRVAFDCDLRLKACDLECTIGLSSYERAFYYVPQAGHISISEVAEGEQPFRSAGAGLLIGEQQVEIEAV